MKNQTGRAPLFASMETWTFKIEQRQPSSLVLNLSEPLSLPRATTTTIKYQGTCSDLLQNLMWRISKLDGINSQIITRNPRLTQEMQNFTSSWVDIIVTKVCLLTTTQQMRLDIVWRLTRRSLACSLRSTIQREKLKSKKNKSRNRRRAYQRTSTV